MLFSSILACAPSSSQRLLLKQCMKCLLDIVSLPIPAVTDQHLDLPQVLRGNLFNSSKEKLTELHCIFR